MEKKEMVRNIIKNNPEYEDCHIPCLKCDAIRNCLGKVAIEIDALYQEQPKSSLPPEKVREDIARTQKRPCYTNKICWKNEETDCFNKIPCPLQLIQADLILSLLQQAGWGDVAKYQAEIADLKEQIAELKVNGIHIASEKEVV